MQVGGNSAIVGYDISESILIELIKANNMDMGYMLKVIPYLHSEYCSVLLEASKDNG